MTGASRWWGIAVRTLQSATGMNRTILRGTRCRHVLLASLLALASTACASSSGPQPDIPTEASVPGFDTRHHPGVDALETWREASPYRWLGFYLPAPCYTGTTWQGRSGELRSAGWGLAVLFVGEQDWRHVGDGALPQPDEAVEAGDPDATEPRCTSGNLTAEKGSRDAAVAIDAAREEGFPAGTWIYLDVEPVSTVSEELISYVRAWTAALLDDGSYRPALYAHDRNVRALLPVVTEAWLGRGHTAAPRLWVTGGRGFDLDALPTQSGHPAYVWQGPLDRSETWGGVTLTVDPNVARSPDPSGG